MAVKFLLSKEDQEKYGGPKEIPWDVEALDEVPFPTLDPLEREMLTTFGFSIGEMLAKELGRSTMRGVIAAVWLARKLADIDTPPLAKFVINARKVKYKAVKPVGDGDPPAEAASGGSSESAPSVKA